MEVRAAELGETPEDDAQQHASRPFRRHASLPSPTYGSNLLGEDDLRVVSLDDHVLPVPSTTTRSGHLLAQHNSTLGVSLRGIGVIKPLTATRDNNLATVAGMQTGVGPQSVSWSRCGMPADDAKAVLPESPAMTVLGQSPDLCQEERAKDSPRALEPCLLIQSKDDESERPVVSSEKTSAVAALQGETSQGQPGQEGAQGHQQPQQPDEPHQAAKPAKITNPATRGRKAALKSDAAGQTPQSFLPSQDAKVVIVVKTVRAPADPVIDTRDHEEWSTKWPDKFPGFASARENEGPWTREAFDLLGMSRP